MKLLTTGFSTTLTNICIDSTSGVADFFHLLRRNVVVANKLKRCLTFLADRSVSFIRSKWPKQRRSYAIKTRFDGSALTEITKLTRTRGLERMELAMIRKRGQTGHMFTRSHLTCHEMLRDTLYIQARRKSTEIFERSPQEIFTNVLRTYVRTFVAMNVLRTKYICSTASTAHAYLFKKIVYDDR